jgi:enoyl-CoA hydratase/carnithine racemase
VGKFKAMQMILFGSSITAPEAKTYGLVAEYFAAGTVLEKTLELASQLAQLSPGALSLAKEAIGRCTSPPSISTFDSQSHPRL